jgi:hypothetical protein
MSREFHTYVFGYQCPSCESDDISYDTHFEDGYIGVVCKECDTKWWEIWTFREISIYEEGQK